MSKISLCSLDEHFSNLSDPRRDTANKRHNLIDIVVIAICGVICGADDFSSIANFGEAKEEWFSGFLELPNGIPSHDTFNAVFSKLNPAEFREGFISWVSSLVEALEDEVVAIDGKTLRGSLDRSSGKSAIHMVSAWASNVSLVLGQIKTAEKSNEITAIPELLHLLDLKGCLVSIDAMGCQKKIATDIIQKQADYLLAVKDNQPTLHAGIAEYFADAADGITPHTDVFESRHEGHGRVEIRRCHVGYEVGKLPFYNDWPSLKSIIMIESERRQNGESSLEYRYYVCSRAASAEKLLNATRTHWGIENSLHWVLDVAFREDHCRIRKKNAAENFAMLRHIALNLLKKETTLKLGIKNKRLRAAWDESYMLKVLKGLLL